MNTAKKERASKKRIIFSVRIFDFKTCCFRMSRNALIQTISIIDDNCGLLVSLSMHLESCGYRTVKFSCSKKALDFHLIEPVDFYFIDVKFLSMFYEVPAKAATPKGHSFKFTILLENLFLSLLKISTYI